MPKPLPATSDIAQEVEEKPVRRNEFHRMSSDCDEEEELFYTPPSTLGRAGSVSTCSEHLPSDPATVFTMPEQMTVRDATHQATQSAETEKKFAHEAEPSSPVMIRSLVERQNEMQLEVQQHRSQLDDLQRSHSNVAQEVFTIPEEVNVEGTHKGTEGTEKKAVHESELLSPAIRSLVERQNEMQKEIQQQQRQLGDLQKSYDDLAWGNSEPGAQGLQAEKLGTGRNLALRLPLTESHIYRISKDLAKNWRVVSLELDLSQADIDLIDADFREVQEKTYQALLCWRRKETSNATVGRLVTALENLGRSDVIDILEGVISCDVTVPVSSSRTPSVRKPNMEAEETKLVNGFSADHAQELGERLELLHEVVQKLTQTDAQKRQLSIQKLLEVQGFLEEHLKEIMNASTMSCEGMKKLKENQSVRMAQSQQTGKLLCQMRNVPPMECKNCKECKSCKEKRRNTYDGSGTRPKLKVKRRQTKSLYSTEED